MNVSEVINTLNRMTADGVIEGFQAILSRHNVTDRSGQFERHFLNDAP